jgi:hypothetical protein
MAIDNDRNRILTLLRDRTGGMDAAGLVAGLCLAKDAVERHLLYCADYSLATCRRQRDGIGARGNHRAAS